MKFFVAIALLAAVASARILPGNLNLTPQELSEIDEIMAAIYSPSTDPTTAAMLEQMLFDLLGLSPPTSPVHIPAIVDEYEPIHVGPAIVDFPVHEAAVKPPPPAPIQQIPAPAASSPLVQIIVNVQQQDGFGVGSPVQVENVEPTPVHIVDKPIHVKPTPIKPIPVKPTPVIVVDQPFEPQPEPVLIGNLPEPVVVAPIIVAPAVVGPDTLN